LAEAWRSRAGFCEAGPGSVRQDMLRRGRVWIGAVWHSRLSAAIHEVRRDVARSGWVRQGVVWRGEYRRGLARLGEVQRGQAGQG
jgi:hypothetical protein